MDRGVAIGGTLQEGLRVSLGDSEAIEVADHTNIVPAIWIGHIQEFQPEATLRRCHILLGCSKVVHQDYAIAFHLSVPNVCRYVDYSAQRHRVTLWVNRRVYDVYLLYLTNDRFTTQRQRQYRIFDAGNGGLIVDVYHVEGAGSHIYVLAVPSGYDECAVVRELYAFQLSRGEYTQTAVGHSNLDGLCSGTDRKHDACQEK